MININMLIKVRYIVNIKFDLSSKPENNSKQFGVFCFVSNDI